MAGIVMPSWLKAPDVGADYARGLSIGAQIGEARQRLDAENTRTAMEGQARAETLKREALAQTARNQTETAYQQQTIALHQQNLNRIEAENRQKTEHAARIMAAQQKAAALRAAGMPEDQVLNQVPELATEGAVTSMQRTKDAEAARRTAQSNADRNYALAQSRENRIAAGGGMDTTATTEIIPGKEGQQEIPGIPAHRTLLHPFSGVPATPGTPGTPDIPAKRITHTVRTRGSGQAPINDDSDSDAMDTGAPPPDDIMGDAGAVPPNEVLGAAPATPPAATTVPMPPQPKFKKGQKVHQNGKIYIFDGENWKEFKGGS